VPDASARPRLKAVYHIRSDPQAIDARAQAIAIEQSVEMPLAAIADDFVRSHIVGQIEAIAEKARGLFEVRIALAAETVGDDPGQLLNVLFGNTSLHDDVALHDIELPSEFSAAFGGPRHGLAGLRRRVDAGSRPLTCSALKPQGLPAAALARLAQRFAQGGIDFIKDDHGLADQAYSPFAERVTAVAAALHTGLPDGSTRYVPSLSGDLDRMRAQLAIAAQAGIDTVMIAPMVAGFANFHRLVREHPGVGFLAHPTMGGAARIAPPLLLGKLFRMLGADAVIFPNHGGRFGYSPDTCGAIARTALGEWHGLKPCLPVPAGGMTTERVGEMLDFYGSDVMLLIGGALLAAGDRLVEATRAFVEQVHAHQA